MSAHEINLALRTAAGHERAAHAAEAGGMRQYEMKMVSAGASVYQAFVLAAKAAPEYQGRKIDDAAVRRLYQSTKARPWWDAHLKSVKIEGKPADREWGKRLIQWHLDPEAAAARHAQGRLQQAVAQKRLRTQRPVPARGMTSSPKYTAPSTAEMREIHNAAQETAVALRELPRVEVDAGPSPDALLAELLRIRYAVQKVQPEDIEAVLDILRTTAREVERYVL
jgi:hypothetical protein